MPSKRTQKSLVMLIYILVFRRCGVLVLLLVLLMLCRGWECSIAHVGITMRRTDWQGRTHRQTLQLTDDTAKKQLLWKAGFSNCVVYWIYIIPSALWKKWVWENRLGSSASGKATVTAACGNDEELPHPTQDGISWMSERLSSRDGLWAMQSFG